jgi:Flp pilus assembly protein TadG
MRTDTITQNNRARTKSSNRKQTSNTFLSETGQSLLEMALLTPMLLALVLGTIEMGRFAYISILVGNAAHAGAAYAAQSLVQSTCLPPGPCGIQLAADNDFHDSGQDVTKLTVTSSTSCGCDNGGTITSAVCSTDTNPNAGKCAAGHWVVMVSVTASGKFDSMFGFPVIPSPLNLSSTATMRVVQQ